MRDLLRNAPVAIPGTKRAQLFEVGWLEHDCALLRRNHFAITASNSRCKASASRVELITFAILKNAVRSRAMCPTQAASGGRPERIERYGNALGVFAFASQAFLRRLVTWIGKEYVFTAADAEAVAVLQSLAAHFRSVEHRSIVTVEVNNLKNAACCFADRAMPARHRSVAHHDLVGKIAAERKAKVGRPLGSSSPA